MSMDDVAGDGEPESGSTAVGCAGLVEPGEAFEDVFPLIWGDAGPIVADGQPGDAVEFFESDRDGGGGVAFGVVEQVLNGPAELASVAGDLRS